MKSPAVSVILPVFNDETRIARAVKSAQNQTIKSVEIIVIDDGSTDKTLQILAELAQSDPRIIVLNAQRQGAYFCRNLGLRTAKGQFITFLDSDDWIEPEMYSDMIRACEKYNAESSICSTRLYSEKSQEDSSHYDFSGWSELTQVNSNNIHKINGALWNKLFRLELINKLEMGFIDSRIAADSEFNWRYYLSFPTVAVVKKVHYNYVRREGSLANHRQNKTSLDLLKSFKAIKENLSHKTLFPAYRDSFYAFITPRIFERLLLERSHVFTYIIAVLKVFGFDYIQWSLIELNYPKFLYRAIKKRYVAA